MMDIKSSPVCLGLDTEKNKGSNTLDLRGCDNIGPFNDGDWERDIAKRQSQESHHLLDK